MVPTGPFKELSKQTQNLTGQFLLFYRKPLSKCLERGFSINIDLFDLILIEWPPVSNWPVIGSKWTLFCHLCVAKINLSFTAIMTFHLESGSHPNKMGNYTIYLSIFHQETTIRVAYNTSWPKWTVKRHTGNTMFLSFKQYQ